MTRPRGGTAIWWWAALAGLLVGTRILARQRTAWEWDDFVFAAALDTFAPHEQVPHPPFYPGFVGVGRVARWIVVDGHAALTWVSVAASVLVLGFLFLATRELMGCWRRAMGATVLFAFFPAVWVHAGIPLSDPLGLAVALAGWWLVLRARRRPRVLHGAAAAAAAAVSVRPQAAVVMALPLLAALAQRPRRQALVAAVVGVAGVMILYALPIVLAGGGVAGPWRVFAYQTNFVVESDSLAAHDWDLLAVAQRYLVDLWATPWLAAIIGVLVVGGAAAVWLDNPRALTAVVLAFGPYVLLTLVFCDPQTAGRYALPSLVMVAILAAVALTEAERRWGLPGGLLIGAVSLACAVVAAPAVMVVSYRASPPVAAAAELRRLVAGRPFQLIFEPSLLMHVAALFPDVPRYPHGARQPRADIPAFYFGSAAPVEGARVFSWPHHRFFARVSRGRYLDVAIALLPPQVTFGAGFFPEEMDRSGPREEPFRWMGERGVLLLPPSGAALRLTADLLLPLAKLDAAPIISVAIRGTPVESFVVTASRYSTAYDISSSLLDAECPTEMVITTTQTFVPAARGEGQDARVLGLQVRRLQLAVIEDPGPAGEGEDCH